MPIKTILKTIQMTLLVEGRYTASQFEHREKIRAQLNYQNMSLKEDFDSYLIRISFCSIQALRDFDQKRLL